MSSSMNNDLNIPTYSAGYDDLPPSYEEAVCSVATVPVVGHLDAPPAYEQTEYSSNPPDVAHLSYADFYPKVVEFGSPLRLPTYDGYRSVVNTANQWLTTVRGYKVLKCESVEQKLSKSYQLDDKCTTYVESAVGTNAFLRGLRIWLVPGGPQTPVQQITYINIVPQLKRRIKSSLRYGGHEIKKLLCNSFDSYDSVLRQFNADIAENPIRGTLLNLETLEMKISEEYTQHRNLDPDQTFRIEMGYTYKLYLTFFRLFHLKDNRSSFNYLGIEDFKPVITHMSSVPTAQPRFESYSELFQKSADWMQHRQDAHTVISMQTIDAQLHKCKDNITVNTSLMLKDQSSYVDNLTVKVLRIAYTHKIPTDIGPHLNMISSKVFVPARLSRVRCENLPQTLYRTDCWLKCTGAHILGIDTINVEYHPDSNSVKTEKVGLAKLYGQSRNMVTTLRLYLNGTYREPNPNYLPPPPVYTQEQEKQSASKLCTIT